MAETTDNAFLGGRLQITQPRKGYRAGIDPVLLAASVEAAPGQSVLELGCGVGTALLCLGARVGGLRMFGIEMQGVYAGLARDNAARNGQELWVHEGDLREMPVDLKSQVFDHVIANPPYFDRNDSHTSPDAAREAGRGGGDIALGDWVEAASRRLRPGGTATFVMRAERLPELLAACAGRLGSLEILPLLPRQGRAARLILLRARKGGRAAFRLRSPVVLHRGENHERDGDDYTPLISQVLRNAAPLPFQAGDRLG